jgi:hypothetical protein
MLQVLSDIILIMMRNYNVLNSFKDDIYNVKRITLVNKTLNLIQKISLSQDNHESILDSGFLNLLEKMCEDYKNEKLKGVNNNDNNYLTNFISKGKFILKECSQSEKASIKILDSPIFQSIVSEIMELDENPKAMNTSNYIKKIFIYDTAVISNVCMNSKSYEQIINKLEIDTILLLGTKTGNVILLEYIINMTFYHLSVNYRKIDLQLNDELFCSICAVIEKIIRNKNRSSILMVKALNLICLLYNQNSCQNLDKLQLLESMNNDMDIFSTNEEYILSILNCLNIIIKINPQNIDRCFEIDLIKKIKKSVYELSRDNTEKYSKIICKLTELYYHIIKNKPENSNKMCEFDITKNIVKFIDIFDKKVEPKSEKEKEIEMKQNQLELLSNSANNDSVKNDNSIKNNNDNTGSDNNNNENALNEELYEVLSLISPKSIILQDKKVQKVNYIRAILMNCINFLNIITENPEVNNYISSNTQFNKCIIASIKNENNDNNYLIIAIHCLDNYIRSEAGNILLKTQIYELYSILKNLQSKCYSNSTLLININYLAGAIILNSDEKNNSNLFFDLVAESIKCQDWNENLIKIALKIMNEGLDKKPLVDKVNEQIISHVTNILKSYQDNYEIQINSYKLLTYFANDEHVLAFSNIINSLLKQIKQSLSNILINNNEESENKAKIRKTLYNLIIFLANISQYVENINNEIIIPFIKELDDFGINEETNGAYIINIFDHLFKNKTFIETFMLNEGLDSLIKVLKTIDSSFHDVNLILQLFSILKKILMFNDDYKIMMQNLKMKDIINKIIKETSNYDKKIEFEGKSLLFLIGIAKKQLEQVEDLGITEIKIFEPIRPEIKNYLTSGKQLKLINDHGEIKEKQLLFTQDLLKVQAKLIKSNFPTKPKYVIETNNIKAIIKGHGTDAFKKSGGLFRSIPKPELCFSIIGPRMENGLVKTLNVVCKSEKEVDKWINYMEIVINHFQKKKFIGNVIIKKNI